VTSESGNATVPTLGLGQLALRFLRFGGLAWGGPIAQIAMLRRELVDEERWISSERFNRTLAVYQVLPGPEAQELCIFFGMLARGRLGGLLAGLSFLLPGFLLMLALAWWYTEIGMQSPVFAAAFAGAQAAVLALITRGLHRIGSRAVTDSTLLAIALGAFAASALGLPFAVPLLAGAMAYPLARRGRRFLAYLLIGAMLAGSVALALTAAGTAREAPVAEPERVPSNGELLASGIRAGALTFGGAYTAIPFVEADAVGGDGWMTPGQFLDGLALSGVIPAPLVIFATFVGYAGGGPLGAVAMTAGIFLPAFAITLVGHRYLDVAVANVRLHAILDGITAGVVGLVGSTLLQLAPTALGTLPALVIFCLALAALYLWQASGAIAMVIVTSAAAGVLTMSG
jgi:chromate transporter